MNIFTYIHMYIYTYTHIYIHVLTCRSISCSRASRAVDTLLFARISDLRFQQKICYSDQDRDSHMFSLTKSLERFRLSYIASHPYRVRCTERKKFTQALILNQSLERFIVSHRVSFTHCLITQGAMHTGSTEFQSLTWRLIHTGSDSKSDRDSHGLSF